MSPADDSSVDRLLRELAGATDPSVVIADPDIVGSYIRDQSRFTCSAAPIAVLAPRDVDDVAACLRIAHQSGTQVIPRGAGSGLSGGANAADGALILSLHRMDRIADIDVGNRTARVQPGVVTAALRAAVAEVGLHYPPDPGSVEFCTIGGNIATNAGGMCCVKYGVTADFVLALQVVLADGRVLTTGHSTVKGVAGYDLTRLIVGSEGTLGVVTEAVLKLVPPPHEPHTMVASFSSLTSAGSAVRAIVENGCVPSMLEILDRTTVQAVDSMTQMGLGDGVDALLIAQCDGADAASAVVTISDLCGTAGAIDVVCSEDPAEGRLLLEARRMALPALERLGDWLLDDVCVPLTRITELIESVEAIASESGLTIGVFGHAGDGNLHPTIIYDAHDDKSTTAAHAAFDAITGRALELGGTVTGEHGVGRLKKSWLAIEQGELGIELHDAIKKAFDPSGILNRDAVFDAP